MMLARITTNVRFWRLFAGISFLNQFVRVPFMLSLATSVGDLESYFVISATSVPVQFIAHEVLQYRSKLHRQKILESLGLSLLVCCSIAYVAWRHGPTLGGVYLVFAAAILIHGASVGHLRNAYSAPYVLLMEALYNTGITIVTVTVVLLSQDHSELGYAVIISQAGMAIAVSAINVIAIPRKSQLAQSSVVAPPQSIDSVSSGTSLALFGIMITTQLERLAISASQPLILACISLAAGVVQAWRKIGLDDAVVFERLRLRSDCGIYEAMKGELKNARIVFYPALLLAFIGNFFIDQIATWCIGIGLFRSLDLESYRATLHILCIYLAVMPVAITMINALRQRILLVHPVGWAGLVSVIILETGALFVPYSLAQHINLAMVVIVTTASLSHILFLALCPVKLNESMRLLSMDVAVFVFTVISLL